MLPVASGQTLRHSPRFGYSQSEYPFVFRCAPFCVSFALHVAIRFCARPTTWVLQSIVSPVFGRGCHHSAGSLICAILDRDLRNILDEFAQFEQLIEVEYRWPLGWIGGKAYNLVSSSGEPRLGNWSPWVVPGGLSDHPCLNLRAIAARCVKSQGDLAGKKVPAQAIGA